MAIPPSNSQFLSGILKKIEDIDIQFSLARATFDDIGTELHETELHYKRAAAICERLRLERNRLLCELRGQNDSDTIDVLSSSILHNARYKISFRKLEELGNAGIVYMGDLAQAKMTKHHGKPLSLHPRLSDGTYRDAGIPVVGKKTIGVLEVMLATHGLRFEMDLPDWIRPINLKELPGVIHGHEELLNIEAVELLREMPNGAPYAFAQHEFRDGVPAILVGDLVQLSEKEVLKMKYIGPKELGYIKQVLKEHGLSLGMHLPNWVNNK